jgi:hypothetical protein
VLIDHGGLRLYYAGQERLFSIRRRDFNEGPITGFGGSTHGNGVRKTTARFEYEPEMPLILRATRIKSGPLDVLEGGCGGDGTRTG